MYEIHPIAKEYADFTPDELKALIDCIAARGQDVPVMIWHGQIVDGRHRAIVCEQLGRKLKIEDITEQYPTEEAMRAKVVALNQHRRSRTRPLKNAEKRTLVEQELASDPGRSNRAIARLLRVNHRFVAVVRAVVLARTMGVDTVSTPTAADADAAITLAKTTEEKARLHSNGAGLKGGHGPQIKVVIDEPISIFIKRGIAMERETGASAQNVAKHLHLSDQTYRSARDIVLLSERDDLNKKDAAAVREAMAELDSRKQVRHAYAKVKTIVERVWGKKGRRYTSDKGRSTQFKSAISLVHTTCESAAAIVIPHLSAEDIADALSQLNESHQALRTLASRIKESQQ